MAEYVSMVKKSQEMSVTYNQKDLDEQAVIARQLQPLVEGLREEGVKMRKNKIMPYDVYVENYLLLHMGFESSNDKYTIEDWLNFAGADDEIMNAIPGYEFTQRGMYSAVDLADSQGRIVATVPPMYPVESYVMVNTEDDTIDTNRTIGTQMGNIRRHGENYREAGKNMARSFFDSLASRFDPNTIEAHRQAWRNFFVRMNVMNPDGTLVVTADENGKLIINNQNNPSQNTAIATSTGASTSQVSTASGINSPDLDDLFI